MQVNICFIFFTLIYRFGTYPHNGLNYICHEGDIWEVLTGRSERHVVTDQQQELIETMSGPDKDLVRLEASLCFLVWETTLADFYEIVKKPTTNFGQTKAAMVRHFKKYYKFTFIFSMLSRHNSTQSNSQESTDF